MLSATDTDSLVDTLSFSTIDVLFAMLMDTDSATALADAACEAMIESASDSNRLARSASSDNCTDSDSATRLADMDRDASSESSR